MGPLSPATAFIPVRDLPPRTMPHISGCPFQLQSTCSQY